MTNTDWTANNYHSESGSGGPVPGLSTHTNKWQQQLQLPVCADGKWLVSWPIGGTRPRFGYFLTGRRSFSDYNERGWRTTTNGVGWQTDRPDKTEAESKKEKDTKQRYGGFGVVDEEYHLTHLWLLDFNLDSIQMAGSLPCYGIKTDSAKRRLPILVIRYPRQKGSPKENSTCRDLTGTQWEAKLFLTVNQIH